MGRGDTDEGQAGYWPPEPDFEAPAIAEPMGLVVAAELPERRLKDDPYNPAMCDLSFRVLKGLAGL